MRKARRLALKKECLKSRMQPIQLVLHDCAIAPADDVLIRSQEVRLRTSAQRLRTKTDMALQNLRKALSESPHHAT